MPTFEHHFFGRALLRVVHRGWWKWHHKRRGNCICRGDYAWPGILVPRLHILLRVIGEFRNVPAYLTLPLALVALQLVKCFSLLRLIPILISGDLFDFFVLTRLLKLISLILKLICFLNVHFSITWFIFCVACKLRRISRFNFLLNLQAQPHLDLIFHYAESFVSSLVLREVVTGRCKTCAGTVRVFGSVNVPSERRVSAFKNRLPRLHRRQSFIFLNAFKPLDRLGINLKLHVLSSN